VLVNYQTMFHRGTRRSSLFGAHVLALPRAASDVEGAAAATATPG